ncbi:MAG: hypothetical protein H6Q90_804 [Deltaproteobacteria bacterium]|nr:hypothetical protein [Deltaproteobacteria bacterium]
MARETSGRDTGLARLRALRTATGGPAAIRGKLQRIRRTLDIRLDRHELRRRLERLATIGIIDAIPSRHQLTFAAADMLRFSILPAARDYYRLKRIPFRFHYFVRFLEDPVSMLDPVGLYSDQEVIIGHLLQAVHLNPVYDLQLLQMFDDGLEDLERQTGEMVAGTHPRRQTIAATIEDPDYHRRLHAFVVAFRSNPGAAPPIREDGGLRANPEFRRAEAQFHTLPAFARYAARLPRSLPMLVRHRLVTKQLDPAYCDEA